MTEQQRVSHFLYEGEIEVWTEDPDDGQAYIILRDGPHDRGDDLGDYLAWLLGPGRATAGGRCKLAKRIRLVVDDLEPDSSPDGIRRALEGDPLNLETARLLKDLTAEKQPAGLLAANRDDWRAAYRGALDKAREAYKMAFAYEVLAARAERAATS